MSMEKILTVRQNGVSREIPFSDTPNLAELLIASGYSVQRPCGGRGRCGKCRVRAGGSIISGSAGDDGYVLACQTTLTGNAWVELDPVHTMEQIELDHAKHETTILNPAGHKLGAAVDIGTTTIAVRVYNLSDGTVIGEGGKLNPQTSVAADVMGRIGAAMNGRQEELRLQVTTAIAELLDTIAPREQIDAMVITGNTTMLYLLTGRNPETLSHAPFEADCLFGFSEKALPSHPIPVFLPECMNAFVGADITCAVLASGMCEKNETALLTDIGTNGEMALWKDGVLYVTSTAAGPAFEGAGISCGTGSIRGAIDHVWLEEDKLCVHTIGEEEAVGICGSGLIDAIAALLKTEAIDETGSSEEDALRLCDTVSLKPSDVRQVQLAKAAIAAGIQTLIEISGIRCEEITCLYIAGGFGSHLNVASAAAIGLIPEDLSGKVEVIGNAALEGAAELLLNRNNLQYSAKIAKLSTHVNLGGNPKFNSNYVDQMFFPEED